MLLGDDRLTQSFWSKVRADVGGCWFWTAAKYKNGYGAYGVPASQREKGSKHQVRLAHRYAYEKLVSVLPREILLDHICHTDACEGGWGCPHRSCVNPLHLLPSSHRENLLRSNTETRKNSLKTHCPKGHEYTDGNIHWYGNSRRCRTCALKRMKAYNARTRGARRAE